MSAIASTTALVGLLMLLGSGWLLEQSRNARSRLRDAAARERLAARVRFIAHNAGECVLLCDASGRIIEANARCRRTYGYSPQEWLRLNMDDVITERHFTLPELVQQIPEERGIVCRSIHARKDGTAIPVEMHASMTEVDGTPCYQLVIHSLAGEELLQESDPELQRASELARRLVNVQEEERRRLARELHDQVGANLATVNLTLRSIRKMLPHPDVQFLEGRLKEAGSLLADSIFSIRNACTELRPAILDYSGLVPALEELAQRVTRRGDLEVRFRQENMGERLPAHTESMLFRIAQEALTNCARHSHASNAEIFLARLDRTVVLSVSDDGDGFDPGQLAAPGLGLLTMRERAAMAGGALSIVSSPGKGTNIRAVVPAGEDPALRVA